MDLTAIIHAFKEAGDISGLGVIGLILYILYKDGVIRFGKTTEADGEKRKPRGVEAKMDKLLLHFNDETTELLTEIRDGIRGVDTKLSEFDKYGIPCRDVRK